MQKPVKKHSTPWYERAFSADYLARYKHRSDEKARAELPFVIKALRLPDRPEVLDLCCGAGRHSFAMARALKRGRVIGLDLSPDLLRAAQKRNMSSRKVCFVRGDMRRLPFSRACMDGVMNLFTSFGYFKTDREHLQVLKEVARVLKPRGRFVLDFFNREHVIATLVPQSEHEGSVERRWYDVRTKRIVKTISKPDGEVLRESVRAYSLGELRNLIVKAGLLPVKVYGDLNGRIFDRGKSRRCVWVCEKPA